MVLLTVDDSRGCHSYHETYEYCIYHIPFHKSKKRWYIKQNRKQTQCLANTWLVFYFNYIWKWRKIENIQPFIFNHTQQPSRVPLALHTGFIPVGVQGQCRMLGTDPGQYMQDKCLTCCTISLVSKIFWVLFLLPSVLERFFWECLKLC